MLVFWIIVAALLYFGLLGSVLCFLSMVGKMNRHWERAFREVHGDCDERWRRAA